MQEIILTDKQIALLPFITKFKRKYYLAGGTAIALQIGHRRSIDFDLFTGKPIDKRRINDAIADMNAQPLFVDIDQQHFLINEIKCTFLYFPYQIEHDRWFRDVITMPSLLDLAAMKVFALGRRSKWKDFVDLYFILKDHYSLDQIVEKAKFYFPEQVTEKLFRNQLAYHKDIDFTEQVDFVIPNPPTQEEIKYFLIKVATSEF